VKPKMYDPSTLAEGSRSFFAIYLADCASAAFASRLHRKRPISTPDFWLKHAGSRHQVRLNPFPSDVGRRFLDRGRVRSWRFQLGVKKKGVQQGVTRLAVEIRQAVCSACGSGELECFFEMPETPTNRVTLRTTREAALSCRTGRIELGFCVACGAISNMAFDPARVDYDPTYDNSLYFSPTFQKYSEGVARDLVERYDLHGKKVIEIGCGQSEFLAQVCALGNNRGIGFDPSFVPGSANPGVGQGITVIRDYYSERYAHCAADFIICRQVFEHIANPRPLLESVRRALVSNSHGALFFEVPSASFIFQKKGFWDVLYEHCFYYSPGALARLFSSCGFDVLRVSETFEGQYVCLEARPCSGSTDTMNEAEDDLHSMRRDIQQFANAFCHHYSHWKKMLDRFAAEGKRMVLWGAGTKGTLFLNTFRDISSLEYIVDVNPRKWGLYIPGSGQKVVSPELLKEYRPDMVLIMNSNYRDEIGRQVSSLGLAPELCLV
jgi:SAM-dependent methyltransferase